MPSSLLRTLFILVSLLTLLRSATAENGLCLKYDSNNDGCGVCYKSMVDTSTGTCGPVLPDSDSCLIYFNSGSNGNSGCSTCKPGYFARFASSGNSIICVQDPNFVQNCFREFQVGSFRSCQACNGGKPSDSQKECLPWNQVGNPIQNCLIGDFRNHCDRCVAGMTWNEDSLNCEVIQGLEGCLSAYKTFRPPAVVCDTCNVFEGYEMGSDLTCTKPQ